MSKPHKILSSSEIGWKLRTLRQQAGLTQEQLAEKMNITSQQIQKYESGANKLNTDRLQQVAQALSIPVQSFFNEEGEALPLEISEKALLTAFRSISNKDTQECILKLATVASKA